MYRPPSLFDTDLYKMSMQNAVCKLFPRAEVEYQFVNRGKHVFPEGFAVALRELVDDFRGIKVHTYEIEALRDNVPYFDQVYLDFLRGYHYDPREVTIEQIGDELSVTVRGPWYRSILWEVPLMASISELYYEMTKQKPISEEAQISINRSKMEGLRAMGVHSAEFGTRRRFSYEVHERFVMGMEDFRDVFVGTSNVHFAITHNWTPIGTIAHEWFQFHAARYGYRYANYMAMENWVQVYNGDLGIALPDTFTTEVFLRSFDTKYAKLFDGGRQDSGDAKEWTDKWTAHYRRLKIDPMSKAYIYSDGINSLDQACDIHLHYLKTVCGIGAADRHSEIKTKDSICIGTWFTNDVGPKPMNMVIKMVKAKVNGEWVDTVKLSDSPGKHTGNPDAIELCKGMLGL